MRLRAKNTEKTLRETLALFDSAATKNAESAQAQTLAYLNSHTDNAAQERFWGSDAVRPAGRPRWLTATAIAASIAIVVLIPVTILRRTPAVFEDAAGSRRIHFGEVLRASDSAGSMLVLADTSRVEMRAKSELSLERADDGVRIQLRSGDIIVNAAKQHGHLYVQTKDVTVSVIGTVFFVNAEEEGSRVAVIEGEVHVQQGAKETKLRPGQQVASSPKMSVLPMKEEIAWSPSAERHLALLQQSTAASPAPAVQSESRVAFEEVSIRPASPSDGEGRGATGGSMSILPSGCGGRFPIQIDPRRFAVYGTTVHVLVTWAYGTGKIDYNSCRNVSGQNLISGGPAWMRSASDLWDIEAVIPVGALSYTPEQLRNGEAPKFRKMLQTMLAERFKLVIRVETKEVPALALMVEKDAPRFTVRPEIETEFKETLAKQTFSVGIIERGIVSVKNALITEIIPFLEQDLGQPILDRTGLTGRYTFVVEYTPLYRINTGGTLFGGRPSLFEALPEQVGLKLEKTRKSMELWSVDHIEKPSEN
jgi:uncharacterized protein (TIGR03435 family)